MAQEGPLTPEKQLLKLIEEPKSKGAGAIQAQAIKYHTLSLFSFSAWLGRFSFIKDGLKNLFTPGSAHTDIVRIINVILVATILFLGFYFVSNLSISIINLKKMPVLKFKTQEASRQLPASKESTLLKSNSYYLEKISQRNIFKIGARKTAGSESASADTSKIMELTQNLKLVGIAWSDNPDAMIEDSKAQRTFFVKKGQMIGEIKVKDITRDKVVLTYDNEVWELR